MFEFKFEKIVQSDDWDRTLLFSELACFLKDSDSFLLRIHVNNTVNIRANVKQLYTLVSGYMYAFVYLRDVEAEHKTSSGERVYPSNESWNTTASTRKL